MLISIIIPTYNEEKLIGRCLASLQKQLIDSRDELEVIVIDDGSTDSTIDKIKHFNFVKLLHQSHLGTALARNQGAKLAKGEILVFVDADMEFDERFIKYLVKPIKLEVVKGTSSKEEFVANWNNSLARCWNWNQNLPAKRRHQSNEPDTGQDFRALLATEFHRVSGFDNIGYTDTWTLATKLGYQPQHAPDAIFYHHNPDTFGEVFHQAKWSSKRAYKLGSVGYLAALARVSVPVSLAIGLYKSLKHREPVFLPFKLTYDLGQAIGILEMVILSKKTK